ncbi:MAG TPA: hypothetical protein H9746_05740 [Candidatus Butyricicoccus avistercoris]|mgnify:FL=1|uniref:Uncharacterized protein n=1 Tax=Candidatus Butyricicoccus avistercoris TaxID=2838518 RepID=A0A9D1THZ1_9FIRM|nr:hypothetical protein [Candidatus Butyricicoccus avistercoris]
MADLQRVFLILFALFAVLTAFFQLRSSMKSGKLQNGEASQDDVKNMDKFAHIFAILSAITLALCIILGVVSRI